MSIEPKRLIEISSPMAFIEIEMTGPNPETESIVEISIVITSGDLDDRITGPHFIIKTNPD